MNQVILILKDEAPRIINVADSLKSIQWLTSDRAEVELEIEIATIKYETGELINYAYATNIDDLSPAQIREAYQAAFRH